LIEIKFGKLIRNKNTMRATKFHILFLLIGSSLGVLFWSLIKLPFYNKFEIVGVLDVLKENPTNDILRFIVFVSFPSLLFFTYFLFKKCKTVPEISFRDFEKAESNVLEQIFYFIICLFGAIYIIQENPVFDTFHEGEALGPAINFLNGGIPYQDFIFCHGLVQDVLRSVWGFELFGKTIGGFRTMNSLLEIITVILFSVFILRYFKGDVKKSSIVFLLIIISQKTLDFIYSNGGNLLVSPISIQYGRDSMLYLFLIVLTFVNQLINGQIDKKWTLVIYLATSYIPTVAFIYSIDRGFYLTGSYIILFCILIIFSFNSQKERLFFALYSFLGLCLGFFTLYAILQEGFDDFLYYVFVEMPPYKEFLDGKPYPIFDHRFLIALILQSSLLLLIINRFLQQINDSNSFRTKVMFFIKFNFLELSLVILSILFYRSVLGRSDIFHMRYGIHIAVILSFLLIFRLIKKDFRIPNRFYYVGFTLLLLVITYRIQSKNLIAEIFPLHQKDEKYIPKNFTKVVSFLKGEIQQGKKVYSLSSEAVWYYFLDQPCPTRFPVTYFAQRKDYQKQVINDLIRNKVNYIHIDTFSSNVDKISIFHRIPIVMDYINGNYTFYKQIGNHIILIKR
jgi:hypothetical protein